MSKMKKILSIMLVCVMVSVLFAGCGQSSSTGKSSSDKIKLGLNYELSGGVASYGQSSVDGIVMAIEEINKAGGVLGKEIELIRLDNKSDAAEATSVATRLVTQDKVVAILGPATSGAFKATIPVATKNSIPVISGSTTAEDVTVDKDGVKEFAFRICFSDSFQGTVMAEFALKELNAKSAVVIIENSSDYSIGLAKSFKDAFTNGGGTIVAEEAYSKGDTDFNAILTKIKGLEFDIIYMPGYYEEAGLIIKQARALQIDKPVLGGDGFESPKLVELAGKSALSKVYYSNHYSSVDKDPKVTKFFNNFKEKYGKEPDAFAALGYDLGYVVADAIKRANSTDPVKIKDALAQTKDFNGVTGNFSINDTHGVDKPAIIIELQDGVQVKATRYNP